MGINTKKERLGSYICQVGYLDIRQQTKMRKAKGRGAVKFEVETSHLAIYHSKKLLQGNFKNKETAIERAKELIAQGVKQNKFD